MAYEPIPHLDKYKLILPLNDSTPTNYAPYGNLGIRLTREGGITHTGASYKHYAASWYSDGSSDGLAITGGAFAYGTEDFTLAFWVNALTSPETYPFIMASSLYNAGNGFIVTINGPATGWGGPGDVSFQGSTALTHRVSFGTGNASPILNSGWRHIAFVRQGVEHYCFVDGVLSQQVTATGLADYQEYQTPRLWGTTDAYTAGDFKGYLQDVISVKGAALWTSDFTPPGPLIETSSLGNIIIAPTNPIPFTLSLSLVESLSATNFSAVVTNANTGFIMSKTTVSGANPTINLSTNDPCFVTLYPDYGTIWAANTAYALNDKVFPTDPVTTPYYYECTTAGTSDSVEPTWPTSAGTVNDGTVAWTLVEQMVQPITQGPLIPT